jgi:hypothetical protein
MADKPALTLPTTLIRHQPVVAWLCQTNLEHGGTPVTPAKDLFAFKSSTGSLARFDLHWQTSSWGQTWSQGRASQSAAWKPGQESHLPALVTRLCRTGQDTVTTETSSLPQQDVLMIIPNYSMCYYEIQCQ